jgi:hypothetical protein
MSSSIDVSRPDPARVWNAMLGGKDNFESDRGVAREVLKVAPDFLLLAQVNEFFRESSCRYLASEWGIDQFLDFGVGMPADSYLHEAIREVQPKARVLYVEHEPIPLRHAQALLADDRNVFVIEGDVLDPRRLLDEHGPVWKVLDPTRPVAVLHTAPLRRDPGDIAELAAMMQNYLAALAPGSFTVISHLLDPQTPEMTEHIRQVEKALLTSVDTGWFRPLDQIATLFTGQDLLTPGIVSCCQWPAAGDLQLDTIAGCVVGGIGQKPSPVATDDPDVDEAGNAPAEGHGEQLSSVVAETPLTAQAWIPTAVPEPLLARHRNHGESLPGGLPEGTPLWELSQALPTRLVNLLRRQDLFTAEQIAEITDGYLLDLPMVGLPSVRIIRDATMSALTAPYSEGKAVRLTPAEVDQIHTLMATLMVWARHLEDEELVSRAQVLRKALSSESAGQRGPRRPEILTGWIHREHMPDVIRLLAELRLYAYERQNAAIQYSTSKLLKKLAPGFPEPRYAFQLQDLPGSPEPVDDHQRPRLRLVSAEPEDTPPR